MAANSSSHSWGKSGRKWTHITLVSGATCSSRCRHKMAFNALFSKYWLTWWLGFEPNYLNWVKTPVTSQTKVRKDIKYISSIISHMACVMVFVKNLCKIVPHDRRFPKFGQNVQPLGLKLTISIWSFQPLAIQRTPGEDRKPDFGCTLV